MSHIISSPRTEHLSPRHSTRRWSDRSVGTTLREIALIATMFILYRQVRHLTSGDVDQAMVNADRIVGFERRLGAFNEGALQQLVLNSRPAIEFLDHYYVFVHFTASFGFMAWVFLRRPEAWGRIRSWFLSVTLAGLVIHVLFPLAPPRMLSDQGFVDTLHIFGPRIYSEDVTNSAANQLAAMPSLHFAWAAIVAAGVISMRRSRWTWLVLLHPIVTLLAIVATANHYWADAMVGGILVAAAIAISYLVRPSLPAFARMPAAASAFRPGTAAFAEPTATTSSPGMHAPLHARVPTPVKAPAFAFSSAFASAARFAQGPAAAPLGPSVPTLPRPQPPSAQVAEPVLEPAAEPVLEPAGEPAIVRSGLPAPRLRISRVSTITAVPVIAREMPGGRRHDLTGRSVRRARPRKHPIAATQRGRALTECTQPDARFGGTRPDARRSAGTGPWGLS